VRRLALTVRAQSRCNAAASAAGQDEGLPGRWDSPIVTKFSFSKIKCVWQALNSLATCVSLTFFSDLFSVRSRKAKIDYENVFY